MPGPPADNLVFRALAAARAAVGGGWPGGPGPAPALAARLEKRIPVAAGLAGGSSDAAATLDGALEAWGAELDEPTRHAVAAHLGSDVPFFLAGGPALVEGRGEHVAPLHGLHGSPGVVLVTPVIAVSTPDVFAAFDAIRHAGRRGGPDVVRPSRRGAARRPDRGQPRRPGGRARLGQRPAAGHVARRPGARPVQAGAEPAPRATDRPVRAPVRRCGRSILPGRRRPLAAETVRSALADGSLDAPGAAGPFVCATIIVGHRQEGTAP